jgi:site-specific recombinase XerD
MSVNLAGFDAWCQATGHSEGTRKLRQGYIRRFLDHSDPTTCTMSDVAVFLARDEWSAATKASARSALMVFFEWMQLEGLRLDSPMRGMKPVKVKTGVPHPCPEQALQDALEQASDRTRLAVMLAAYAGLRRAEVASLHSENIGDAELRVTGKGERTRHIPIHTLLEPLVAPYRGKDLYLFPSPGGGHLTPTQVGRIVSKVLPVGFSTHSLRHRFATQVHTQSRNLRAVQTLLGHASVATTQIYTNVSSEELSDAVGCIA